MNYDTPDADHMAWLHEQDVKYGRVAPVNESEQALRDEVLKQINDMTYDGDLS